MARAWEIACETSGDWRRAGVELAQNIVGAKNSLAPVFDYMTMRAPDDDQAELARGLFYDSFLGVVDPDGTRAGQIIDRLALALGKRGIG